MTLGVGAGWLREEFETLGLPSFDERGAVTDEYIRAFIELWTADSPTFGGKYVNFSNIHFLPKPVQRPIYLFGSAGRATERLGAPLAWATPGIPWAPIQTFLWGHRNY